MSTPGEKLHKLREEHDMSMQELADLVGVHKGTIFKWEHDQVPLRKAARSSLERLAGALRVEIEREKIKKPQIPKEFLRQWLVSFRDGSVLDDDFAERMADAFLYSVKCYEDHVVVAFNVLGDADGRLVSTLSLEVDFLNLRSNTPIVFWPFIILRIPLGRK